jgi:large subunit ribosomal protein L1
MESLELKQALEELRKGKERKFNQTVDLIINLKGIDLKKTNISLVINVPHKFKEKKVCGFLTKKSNLVKTVTKPEFAKYKDPAMLRGLVGEYDFFIAHGSLMPAVATTFGKALGPSGKMPSPQLGILMKEDDDSINAVLEKIGKSIKIRLREASIKVAVGKSDMKDEDIIQNINAIYNAVENALPTKKENVKNVLLKFTMTKPQGVKL